MEKRELHQLFAMALLLEEEHASNATGDTPKDYLYEPAESVRKSSIPGYVYVTFRGKEYGPERKTWGALDGDKNKSTVLIQAEDSKYWKLWYFDNAVQQ